MDIRNWLQPKNRKATEPKKRRFEDDEDDDVIPESPDVQIINKKKKTSHNTQTSINKPGKEKLKEVKATNLFGHASIKRTEPIVKKETKKTETGIHSDEDFEKSLIDLDILDQIEANDQKNHVDKQKNSNENQKKENEKSLLKNHNNKKMENKNDEDSSIKVKNNGNHVSDNSPFKSRYENLPSTSKDAKKVDNIKKEIKETNKRKFAEFIEGDGNYDLNKKQLDTDNKAGKTNGDVTNENHDITLNDSMLDYEESKNKKKRNKSLNESVLTDEERHERKMHSAKLYQSYLNRSGPKHLGSKEMPEGAPNCLKDFAFLLTGVLDSFEREEIVETINRYGGCVKSGISKKVTHVLAGDDAGPAKMAKAQELGIRIINEDDFLKIIKDSNKQIKIEQGKEKKPSDRNRKSTRDKDNEKLGDSSTSNDRTTKLGIKKEKNEHKDKRNRVKTEVNAENSKESSKNESRANERNCEKTKSPVKIDNIKIEKNLKSESESTSSTSVNKEEPTLTATADIKSNVDTKVSSVIWVEKYKPQNVKQIIGQTGENSNVNKLIRWLSSWYANRRAKLPKPSPWARDDGGGYFKAALLSGPPGVGKTTTVELVCKQLGFDVVEYNASDTRNKALIREQIGDLLTTASLSAYAKGATGKQAVTKKHVLVMDEVDGMAGNEDRGGLQELIGLIKCTAVPIICMCNDRSSQKMRSLLNYCYELRFNKPKVEQIKAALRSICCRERVRVPAQVVEQLVVGARQDVRQAVTLLSVWAAEPARLEAGDAARPRTDVKLGPWEAVRKVFSAEEHKTMSINDKSELFFYDYSLAPLFVHENYLHVQPHCPRHEVLERISEAADCISIGDLVDKRIRNSQAWSLLPVQAMYSSVLPGHQLAGHVAGQIQFPGWLGKNSRANKMHRLCQEIHAHTRLSTSGSKSSIYLEYAAHLRDAVIAPLVTQGMAGVERSVRVLDSYHLLREDLDSLVELSVWPGQRNPTVLIDSKVKAAMTRTYNKKASALPYAAGGVRRARPRPDALDDDEDEEDGDEDSSDAENDALIKKKKSQQSETSLSSASSDRPSTSKGKSHGKGTSGKGKKK